MSDRVMAIWYTAFAHTGPARWRRSTSERPMKRAILSLLFLASAGFTASIAQDGGPPYVGPWTADLKGTTFIRLELTPTGDTLGGRISLGNIHLDQQGRVDRAEAAPASASPIGDVVASRTQLSFSRKDGDDTDRFELHLLDRDSAELRFILTDAMRQELATNGVPIPKPVVLTRAPR